jgi:16S rRNA processing protein RimM
VTDHVFDPETRWIDIGRIGRPHGLRGQVHLQLFNPDTDMLERVPILRAHVAGRPAFGLKLESLRPIHEGFIATFQGVTDREGAAKLTHAVISVDEKALPEPEEGEFYLHQVIGAIVYEAATGERVGVVSGLMETHTDLLAIKLDAGGEALVPIEADAIESMGREPGKIVIRDVDDWRSS